MNNRLNFGFAILLLCLTYFAFSGCSTTDSPTGPTNTGNDTAAKNAGQAGAEIYQNIAFFSEINNFVVEQNQITSLDIPEFETPQAAARFSQSQTDVVLRSLRKRPETSSKLQGAASDSVIFDYTERDSVAGFTRHVRLVYQTDAGTARLYVVNYDYGANSVVKYDSTEIRADLNHTLFNDTDDVLLSVHSLKRFKDGQLIKEESGSFVPDTYPAGTEPDGGVLTSEITYASASFISRTTASFEYHANSGGSYSKTSYFSDNTQSTESATFALNGNGTFEQSQRDGTTISGTFNGVEDDGQGAFTKTTTYPSGHNPISVFESGEFTFNASDSTLNGAFTREVTPQQGEPTTEQVTINQVRQGEVLVTTLNIDNNDGSSGFITITETRDVDQISGELTNTDETFVTFRAQGYTDDSAHLEFEVYASEVAFENQEDPQATAVFDFYPDGSGRGVVTDGDDIYDVIINPDGSVEVTKRS